MRQLFAVLLSSLWCHAGVFHATEKVEAYFRYGTEWYDLNGNMQAWSYYEIGSQPWEGGLKYTAFWAGKACCGFYETQLSETTAPITFTWPVVLIQVPDIDPAWVAVSVNTLSAYDYPNYTSNGGYPSELHGYLSGDMWADEQGGEILLAFGDVPGWWADPFSLSIAPGSGKGKKLGHSK